MTTKQIHSAGIIPVRRNDEVWEFLILRCYNYWDFPKGEVEKDEDQLSTALRELMEETGIAQASLKWGERFYETEPYSKGKIARYYLAEVQADRIQLLPNPESGIIEHHEYRWVDYRLAHRLFGDRLKKVIDWAKSVLEE